jgi:hypothetical protein
MVAFYVEADENVVLVRSPQEKPREIQLPLGQIGLRFESLNVFSVSQGQDNDGEGSIDAGLGKPFVKDGAHTLKFTGHLARPVLTGIGDHDEVWGADFQPGISFGAGKGGTHGDQQKDCE